MADDRRQQLADDVTRMLAADEHLSVHTDLDTWDQAYIAHLPVPPSFVPQPAPTRRTDVSAEPIEDATVEQVSAALQGSDQDWHDFSGACGGCGMRDCHEGRCPTSLCNVCPSRIAEGWFE